MFPTQMNPHHDLITNIATIKKKSVFSGLPHWIQEVRLKGYF